MSHLTCRDERYEQIGTAPHIRTDGSATTLAVWRIELRDVRCAVRIQDHDAAARFEMAKRRCSEHRRGFIPHAL
jgi:hypothetical protein